jgi:modification methylase
MTTTHRIITGDSRQMNLLPGRSVHLVVTSPPYWQLKDYGSEAQTGYHDSYEDYINHLNLVWKECHRVLHPGCRLCVNIGDQFARSVYYGRYKVIPIRTEIIKFCETTGFDYMGAIIWQKVTTTNTTGGATIMGSFPHPRNGILKIDYEFILLFKKPGKAPKPTLEQKKQSAMTTEEWNTYFSGHWNFPGVRQDGHIAMFPEELPARLIKMFSFPGETVLDPFLGSGTTSLAAQHLGRHSVGYEINPEFLPIIREKLGDAALEFLKDSPSGNFEDEIARLPYIFKDPLKLDKKIDLKKQQFGSSIDGKPVEREEYFTVKEIISPTLVKLSDGQVVRLLGVKEKKVANGQAVEFLTQKTKGKKVYLRFDEQKLDGQKRPLCYLYLKNRTFLNAHLIKNGWADADTEAEFRYKEKFLKLQQNT